MKNKHSAYTPLLMAICAIVGIVVGIIYTNHNNHNSRLKIVNQGTIDKLEYIMSLINERYVDDVDASQLIEDAIPKILTELDPHSSYISAAEAEVTGDELKGSFSGIGVSFVMQRDTVTVMQVIKGGPSEKVGLMAGDRIITANDSNLVGIDNIDVMKMLKGEKGSHVKLSVIRHGKSKPMSFDIVRGDVPVASVPVKYLIDDHIGYIKVSSFGEKTYEDFVLAMTELGIKGMDQLILDLRGNRGGYMHIATNMINEFLPKNKLIVYIEGRQVRREESRSNGYGSYKQMPIVVLIDEGSASASEIMAGAIQDNDRGLIIGRRSFGKGLVQEPMDFKDGSSLRLTIARYYTPSGRCIQKPYEKGHDEEYENELLTRYERGEFFSMDSIRQDGPEYHTANGRVVYGGGGITPDIFIAEDTTDITSYYKEAVLNGYIRQFALNYVDQNRDKLKQQKTSEGMARYLRQQNILDKFARFAEGEGLQRRNLMLQKSQKLFDHAIIANIIYNVATEEEYQEFINKDDRTVLKAVEMLRAGEAFPKAPENN